MVRTANNKQTQTKTRTKYQAPPTLGEVMEQYFKVRVLRDETAYDYKLRLKYVQDWHSKRIDKITKPMVLKRHLELQKIGKRTANAVAAVLRALFNFANDFYNIEPISNPVATLKARKLITSTNRQKEHLRDEQIGPWLKAVGEMESRTISDYLTLLLFTGLRPNEGSRIKWEHVNLDEQTIHIPRNRSNRPYTIPIHLRLVLMLRERKEQAKKGATHVFPSRYEESERLTSPRKSLKKLAAKTGIPLTPSWLRRTFTTIAANKTVQGDTDTIRAAINHKQGSTLHAHYMTTDIERVRVLIDRVGDYCMSKLAACGGNGKLLR